MQCERETEKEQEQEEKRELEVPKMTPVPEIDWDYTAVAQATSVHELPMQVLPFSKHAVLNCNSAWRRSNVYGCYWDVECSHW